MWLVGKDGTANAAAQEEKPERSEQHFRTHKQGPKHVEASVTGRILASRNGS